MPMPFQCHWCDKPTMKIEGICIECEQRYEEGNKDIAATVRELESKVKRYEDAMKEILDCCYMRDNYGFIEDVAKTSLDGEPTTADEYNKGVAVLTSGMDALAKDKKYVRISDVNKEIAKEWNRDREEKINRETEGED